MITQERGARLTPSKCKELNVKNSKKKLGIDGRVPRQAFCKSQDKVCIAIFKNATTTRGKRSRVVNSI
ncbi:unnamed protein product [Lathyrus oleraceus]